MQLYVYIDCNCNGAASKAPATRAIESHEDLRKANRYINMKPLKEHNRELTMEAA